MAVTVVDKSLYQATETLISKSPRKYYHTFMHADHWQLRSLIGSPKANIIHYPNGSDIYRLDTVAREREVIATISFSPRCLTAEQGWICCGGENGDFVAIHLASVEDHIGSGSGVRADADSRLPLSLNDPGRRLESSNRPESSAGHRRSSYHPSEKAMKIGDELVNCITMWFPPSNALEETHDKPVAVLSNNDHSVTILDLETKDIIEKLELDDCVNRAVISPDGRMLIAIGDDPYMHVYHRKYKGFIGKGAFTPRAKRQFAWVKFQQVHLQGQRSSDKSEMRGSFATAFSPSGRYLAVGTQYGVILIFETSYLTLTDADPTIISFTTTRPNVRNGAVRAMEFSPEPYDLLAWTEEDGRVTVADIRQCFTSRQVITMDPRAEGLERVGVIERSDELVIDPRLRQFRIHPDGNSSDSIAAEMEQRQLRYLSRERLDRLHSPLTPEETEVLEALQVSRRQREREASRQALTGVTHTTPMVWSDLVDDIRSNWREHAGLRGNTATDVTYSSWREHPMVREGSSGLPPASLRQFVSGGRSTDTLRAETLQAFIDDRNQERERRGQQPRRRGSIILAAAGNALNRDLRGSEEAQPSAAGDLSTGPFRVTPTPPQLPAIRPAILSDSPNNPWAEIEALYNLAVDPPVDPTNRMRIETAADNRRDYTRRLEQRWQRLDERHRFPSRLENGEAGGGSNLALEPVKTTGCCWSKDGKILYVGAENGIYEYHVDILGRKSFPSITFL